MPELNNSGMLPLFIVKCGDFCHISGEWMHGYIKLWGVLKRILVMKFTFFEMTPFIATMNGMTY